MLRVCVLGHSLVPVSIPLNLSVQLEILRYPGATISTLTEKLTDLDFWTRRYDGIIICIGGNDLARLKPAFHKRISATTKHTNPIFVNSRGVREQTVENF